SIMAVSDGEHGTFDIHREEGCGADLQLRCVHIPAETLRCERRVNFPASRRDSDRAQHRLERQGEFEITAPALKTHGLCFCIEVIDPSGFRECSMKKTRAIRRSQSAEQGNRRRCSPSPCGGEINYVDRQCVSRLGTIDIERPGLRIQPVRVQLRTGYVRPCGDCVVERVFGPHAQSRSWLDLRHWRSTAEGVDELIWSGNEVDD